MHGSASKSGGSIHNAMVLLVLSVCACTRTPSKEDAVKPDGDGSVNSELLAAIEGKDRQVRIGDLVVPYSEQQIVVDRMSLVDARDVVGVPRNGLQKRITIDVCRWAIEERRDVIVTILPKGDPPHDCTLRVWRYIRAEIDSSDTEHELSTANGNELAVFVMSQDGKTTALVSNGSEALPANLFQDWALVIALSECRGAILWNTGPTDSLVGKRGPTYCSFTIAGPGVNGLQLKSPGAVRDE